MNDDLKGSVLLARKNDGSVGYISILLNKSKTGLYEDICYLNRSSTIEIMSLTENEYLLHNILEVKKGKIQ